MSTVPQPEKGSVAVMLNVVPSGLQPGFYLDVDVALLVGEKELVVVGPDHDTAKKVAASLSRTAWNWRGNMISDQEMRNQSKDYDAWLKLALTCETTEGLDDKPRESGDVAKTVSKAVS